MTLDEVDKTGLIRESYRIDGISAAECRSIFLDWAIKLPAEITPQAAITLLLQHYATEAGDHPMTTVLRDGMGTAEKSGRRGGRSARVSG